MNTNWKKKLSGADLEHIEEECMRSFADVERNVLHQNKQAWPCWQCVDIGYKLGLNVDLVAYRNRD